uniref:ABC transporter domain-containing protein n=1 Tax=Tolypothrix bouteillei VB521301 TaxID=1479485 RepID=A0A0C1MXM9_9CYAN
MSNSLSSSPILEAQNVHAGYIKDVDILQGVNFRVDPGELVTVIGPNGAGKSTLAKTIFGLLTPHTGTITFKGENIVGLKSNQIKLACKALAVFSIASVCSLCVNVLKSKQDTIWRSLGSA